MILISCFTEVKVVVMNPSPSTITLAQGSFPVGAQVLRMVSTAGMVNVARVSLSNARRVVLSGVWNGIRFDVDDPEIV
jgi:hypothetical protein